MTYIPTGYKPGRPRKGEIRPKTPKGEAFQKYYYNPDNMEHILELKRESSRKSRLLHPDRERQYKRSYQQRKQLWKDTLITINKNKIIIHGDSVICQIDN